MDVDEGSKDVGTTVPMDEYPQAGTDAHSEPTSENVSLQDRIRDNPDFAWEQVQKRDQRISEQSNRLKEFDTISPYVQAAGGSEQLLSLATVGSQIQNIPGLQELVQDSLAQGRVAVPEQAPADDPEDEFMDEDTKRVRDELRTLKAETEAQVKELKQLASVAATRSLETHVRSNMSKALEVFEADPTAKAAAEELISAKVAEAQRLAESGNESQQQMINRLAQPGGHEVLEVLLLPLIKEHGSKLFAAPHTETQETVLGSAGQSADERIATPSRPGAPQLPPVPKGPVTPQVTNEIFREISRRRGRPLN